MRRRVLLFTSGALIALLLVPVLLALLSRPQSILRPPVDLDTLPHEEIRFDNAAAGIGLAGLLFVPEGQPPFPSVVIIHGSGSSRRSNPWYLSYARHLRENGILVLLPDKRGSEASGGDWRNASLQDLATDTQSAINYLRTQRASLVHRVGVLGVSQGGYIAPVVAAGASDMAFVINVVGGAVPMRDVLLYEENHNLRQVGFLPGFSNVFARLSTFYICQVSQREFWSAVGNFDPLPYWREVDVPTLVVYGDQDTNVPSGQSRDRLNALGKRNLRVVVFEGSGHGLEPQAGVAGDYIRQDALDLIRDFIRAATASR